MVNYRIKTPTCRMLPILAFVLSYGVHLEGYSQLIVNWPEEQEEEDGDNNVTSIFTCTILNTKSFLYPFFTSLFVGPILILTGILHVSLTGTASSVTGAILTVLSTIHFACKGHVAYTIGQIILNAINYPFAVHFSLSLMLTGVAAEALSWIFVMIVTVTEYRECQVEQNEQRSNHKQQKILLCPLFSLGPARQLGIDFTLLSATGWLAFTLNHDGLDEIHELGTLCIGPILFLISLLYAGYSKWMRVPTYVFSTHYIMLMGAGLFSYSEAIRSHEYHNKYVNYFVMLAGNIASLVFWTCVLILCQFYHARAPQRVQRAKKQEVNADQLSTTQGKDVTFI